MKINIALAGIFWWPPTLAVGQIKGDTVPKQVEFPEWTEEQLKLWEEKDEAACQRWRDAKEKDYEGGKLKDKYPTREEFDSWLDKQCKTSKDKSLWKRTKHAQAKAAEDK